MTTSHWLRPPSFTTPEMSADVVIVGAGYVGLATAWWISEYRPDLKIIILDRSHTGAGASGRNAGFLTMGSATFYKHLTEEWGVEKAKNLYQFARESLDLLDNHILKSAAGIHFEKTSSLTLFQTPETKSDWDKTEFVPEQFQFHWKSENELSSSLRGKFYGALENGPEFKINPVQLLQYFKNILEKRNIQIFENISAYEVTAAGILTEVNRIRCKQVVLALNGYLPQFHSVFKELITPARAQMMAVELEDDIDSQALHYDSPQRVYWRKDQDKILLIGGKRVLDEHGEIGEFEKISSIVQAGLEAYLHDQLQVRFKVIQRWSGTMAFTAHELPILTRIQAPLETYVIGGFSGHGMGFGFRSAREMAELLTGKISHSFFDSFKKVNIHL